MHKPVSIDIFKTWNQDQRDEYGKNIPVGTTLDENGDEISYKDPGAGWWYEYTFDENGKVLTYIENDGLWQKYTYDENGEELTFAELDIHFQIKGEDVTKEKYEEFIRRMQNGTTN